MNPTYMIIADGKHNYLMITYNFYVIIYTDFILNAL